MPMALQHNNVYQHLEYIIALKALYLLGFITSDYNYENGKKWKMIPHQNKITGWMPCKILFDVTFLCAQHHKALHSWN